MIRLENLKCEDRALKTQLTENWKTVLGRPEVGFSKLPQREADWQAIAQRAQVVRPARRALILGIGGSSLGTQVLAQAFATKAEITCTFLESPDPHSWAGLRGMAGEEWRDKHVVIVSKSGNTLETLSWVEALAAHDPNWLKNSQVTVIASPGQGPLQRWAEKQGLPILWIPSNVGGRFSVLTAVAMWPAQLMGLNVNEFRRGAQWALDHADLATDLSAEIVQSWQRGAWITQLWNYSESLRIFGEWWQQLWGESLAKKADRQGQVARRVSTPMTCCGPRDQHSLVQQLMEGAADKHVLITRVASLSQQAPKLKPQIFADMAFYGRELHLGEILAAEAEAFSRSLDEAGITSTRILIPEITEATLGAQFMLWQMVIAQLGEYLAIDAFNQPGVEMGKKYASAILRA